MTAVQAHTMRATDSRDIEGPRWRPLRYFNYYRTILSGLFVILTVWGVAPSPVGETHPTLFQGTALAYLAFAVASSFAIHARRPPFDIQVLLQVAGDIVAITAMMHASGGLDSGFGILLVVAIAGGSILTEGRTAILFAALASLAVLAEQVYAWLYGSYPVAEYAQAGTLGVAFFATAILAHVLARRVRASEALAERRGLDLASLAKLNERIIARMQSGIAVIDAEGKLRLTNTAAQAFLGLDANATGKRLEALIPALGDRLAAWQVGGPQPSHSFQVGGGGEVMASFASLGRRNTDGVLVFLDDAAVLRQRVQQLKLASLGRLTASIAHEIRNPLGAVSHAAQLLAESGGVSDADRRLTGIVQNNCRRMNAIVENVLQLSRRKASVPERVDLRAWLDSFADEFRQTVGVSTDCVSVVVEAPDVEVSIDPGQLHQVVWNLCENGLRHGGETTRIELRCGMAGEIRRPYLDVVDNGKGIPLEEADSIFEPFFTTDRRGTGLGLYIARELCESNQATLNLVAAHASGACFRVTFSRGSDGEGSAS